MKRHMLFLLLLPLLGIAGCKSGPREIEAGLTPPEYFQRAQQAVIERSDYDTALAYYNAVLEQFPNDRQNGVIARYEIAFIHYKEGDYDTAREQFENILSIYEEDETGELPPWPPVLSAKLLKKMEDE